MTGSASASELLGAAVYYGLGIGSLVFMGFLLFGSYGRMSSRLEAWKPFSNLASAGKFFVGLFLVVIFAFAASGGNDVLENLVPPRMGFDELLNETLGGRSFGVTNALPGELVALIVLVSLGLLGVGALWGELRWYSLFALSGACLGALLVLRFNFFGDSLKDFILLGWRDSEAARGWTNLWILALGTITSGFVATGIGFGLVEFTKSLTPAGRVERLQKQHEKAQEEKRKTAEEERKTRERVQREEIITQVRGEGRDLRDSKSDLSGSLRGANLAGCDLSKVEFHKMQIDPDMTAADFSGAKLSSAYFGRVNLSYADFSGADLFNTILSSATLRWATFNDAHMRGALLIGSDLRGADLSGTKGTLRRSWSQSLLYDDDTTWGPHPPSGIHWESNWERFEEFFEESLRFGSNTTAPQDPEAFLNEHGWSAFLEQINWHYG